MVKLQEWTAADRSSDLVVFEGRDAAGKGGAIKRITEYLSSRGAPMLALPTPGSGAMTVVFPALHRPSASKGEIVLFDLLVQRAGVETVMGFWTPEEYERFLRQTPIFEEHADRRWYPAAQILVLGLTMSSCDASSPGIDTPCAAGSSARWTWIHQALGGYSRPRTRDLHTDTAAADGSWWSPTSRSTPGSNDRAPAVDHPLHRGTRSRGEAAQATYLDRELPEAAREQFMTYPTTQPAPGRSGGQQIVRLSSLLHRNGGFAASQGLTFGRLWRRSCPLRRSCWSG